VPLTGDGKLTLAPSGRELARQVAAACGANARAVVELGGGTGAITEALLERGIHPERLLVLERNPELYALLLARFPEVEIVRGDACYQSYICHLPRSVMELGLNGSLDCLDGMIFPSTCDVIRNLSGMWQIIFPGKFVHYFDMPQNFDAAIGGAFYSGELRTLLQGLAELAGRAVTDDDLRRAVAAYNENRRLVSELRTAVQQLQEREKELERELTLRTKELKEVVDRLLAKKKN